MVAFFGVSPLEKMLILNGAVALIGVIVAVFLVPRLTQEKKKPHTD